MTTTLTDYQIKYTKYKWEFLRRNPDYIKDWEIFKKNLEAKYEGHPPDFTLEEMKLSEKWHLQTILNPYVTYDEYTKNSFILKEYNEKDYLGLAAQDGILSGNGFDVHRLMFEWLNWSTSPTLTATRWMGI